MFRISPQQLNRLTEAMRASAAKHLVAHVQLHFSRAARLAGEPAVRRLAERCLEEGRALGLFDLRGLLSLLSMQLYFGTGFRHDPMLRGFTAILERNDVATAEARIARCWREGMAFHARMAGDDGELASAAVARLTATGLARLGADAAPLDARQADLLLAEVWPSKHALLRLLDPAAFGGFLTQLSGLAKRHGIREAGAARVLLVLAWVFGTGFVDDPMLAPLGALVRAKVPMNAAALNAADAFLAMLTEPSA